MLNNVKQMNKIDSNGKVNTPALVSTTSGSGNVAVANRAASNSGIFSLPSVNKFIDEIYGPIAVQANGDVSTCQSPKGALETILLPKEYRRFTLDEETKVPKEIERAVLRSFGFTDHFDFPASIKTGLGSEFKEFSRIKEIKEKLSELSVEDIRRKKSDIEKEVDGLYVELEALDKKIAGNKYESLFRQKLYSTCLKDVFLGYIHRIALKSSVDSDKKTLLEKKLKGFLIGLLSKRVSHEGISRRTSKSYIVAKSYYDEIKASETYPDGLNEALNICFKNQSNYLLSLLLDSAEIPENMSEWFDKIDGGNPDSVKEFAEIINEVNDFHRIYSQIETIGGTRDCILVEGLERLAVKLQTGDFTKESTEGSVHEQLIAHGINKAIDYYQRTLELHFPSSKNDTTPNTKAETPTSLQTSPRLDPLLLSEPAAHSPRTNGSAPHLRKGGEVKSEQKQDTNGQSEKAAKSPNRITETPQPDALPDFSFTTEDTPSVIASRKNGSHKKGKTTPAQTNFNNRRLLVAGLGTAGGLTILGLGAWALGLVGGDKPEQNNTTVPSNGNNGTPTVKQGTEVKTASEADKKKAELVAEIVKLKAEFSTYTDAEDKEQVSKVYLNHGLNVTMASETQLKGLSEEALRDIYVESLDASCRVVAKKELAELKVQYPVEGFDLTKPEEREKLKINLNNVYFKLLYFYLAKFPSEEYVKKNFNRILDHIKKIEVTNDAPHKADWDKFIETANNYSKGKSTLEELIITGCKLPSVIISGFPIIHGLRLKYKVENEKLNDTTGIPNCSYDELMTGNLREAFSEAEYNELLNNEIPINSLIQPCSFENNDFRAGLAQLALLSFKDNNGFKSDEPEFLNKQFQQTILNQYKIISERIENYKTNLIKESKKSNTTNNYKALIIAEKCLIRLKEIILSIEKKYKEINM